MDTERASPRYSDIDIWAPLDIAEAMIEGQFTAVAAVRTARFALLDAALAGIGWGMNPARLTQEHLKSGALVELVPGRGLPVPLYWQHSRLQVPMLGRLTQAGVETASRMLR